MIVATICPKNFWSALLRRLNNLHHQLCLITA